MIEKTNPKSFLKIPRKFLAGLIFLIALCVVGLPSEVFSTAISSNTFDHQSIVEVKEDSYNTTESEVSNTITLASSNITQDSSNIIRPKKSLPNNLDFYPPDIKKIIKRGYIEVAMISVDSPPFFQVDTPKTPCKGNSDDFVTFDNKVYCGLDVSLSKGIADQLGVDVHFIRSANTFNDTVDLVFENKADIAISKISRTLSRTKKVSFSKPYLTMKQSLLLNRVQFAEQSSGKRPEIAIRELTGNAHGSHPHAEYRRLCRGRNFHAKSKSRFCRR